MAFDPANPSVLLPSFLIQRIVPGSGDPFNGMLQSANGFERGGFENRGIQYGPAFGFAFDVFGNNKSVLRGGYRGFDIAMKVCIGVMFVTIALTAAALWPGTGQVLRGLFVPALPRADSEAIVWTVSLIGGIGGTLTGTIGLHF